MSPPIRDGSGSSIGSIRLGDGSEIAEVRTGAGDVLFSAIPDSGVARWTFDDADTSGSTAIDVFGNNDGTINGVTTGVSGANQTFQTAEAYSFDGANDFVSFPSLGIFDGSQSFSLAAWFRREGSGDQMIISAEGERIWRLKYDSGNNALDFNVFDGSSTALFSNTSISLSTFFHAVAVYDASNGMELYLDGSSEGSNSITLTPNSVNGENTIGIQGDDQTSKPFNGVIDDVRIYDKALTDAEVSNLFNTGRI